MKIVPRYERRFIGKEVPMKLKEIIKYMIIYRKISFNKYVFEEVFPEDERYENAPYCESIVYKGEWVWKNY